VSAFVALWQGRVSTARRLASAAMVSYREDNAFSGGDWCSATLALAAAQADDADTAAAALDWVSGHPFVPGAYRVDVGRAEAWLAAARGEVSTGRRLALSQADDAASSGARVPELLALLDVVRLGGAATVEARLRLLVEVVEGPFAATVADFATAMAHADGARLDAASDRFAAMGARLLAVEASAEAARAHQAAGHPGSRLSSLARARTLAAGCEGARTPAMRDLDADPGLASLTDREREIAELAVRGMTNREVAERLHLSVRTVHTHLQRAYAKLGVHDRERLAELLAAGSAGGC